jgi:hypothetical protein
MMMRRVFYIVCCFMVLGLTSPGDLIAEGYTGPKDKLDIYLLIGQSNMAGRAPFTEDEAGPIENAYLLDAKGEWVPAKNPLNIYSSIRKGAGMQKMNPGYLFTKTMLKQSDGHAIGLVVNAKGGTKIEQWVKGTNFYNDALKRARQAMESGTLKGILWHQGESDEKTPDGYLEKLVSLVEDLRKDLDAPNLPFVAGQVNNVPEVNEQIAKLPTKVKQTSYVSSEGLKCMDRWHFDAPSMRLLGERYAEEMIKLQKK